MKSYVCKSDTGDIGGLFQLIPNPGTIDTLTHGLNVFGFLIRRGETLTPDAFIERIRGAYDCDTVPQNRAVVEAFEVLI